MEITWDEPKRLANLDKHGIDFAVLTVAFFEKSVVVPAKGARLKAIGRLENGTAVVIFARLGLEGIAVISLRPASPKERRLLK